MKPMRRRIIATGLLAALAYPAGRVLASPVRVDVWKSPDCGCCKDWVVHLEDNGFTVSVHDEGNTAKRKEFGIAPVYGSCHTATVAGYAIEGHVPAREVRRLLQELPPAIGLAVPGMPVGSPGMDGPAYGGRKNPYEVLLLGRDGGATRFASY